MFHCWPDLGEKPFPCYLSCAKVTSDCSRHQFTWCSERFQNTVAGIQIICYPKKTPSNLLEMFGMCNNVINNYSHGESYMSEFYGLDKQCCFSVLDVCLQNSFRSVSSLLNVTTTCQSGQRLYCCIAFLLRLGDTQLKTGYCFSKVLHIPLRKKDWWVEQSNIDKLST